MLAVENQNVTLTGVISQELQFSHSSYGEKFYKTFLDVKRMSGTVDNIPIQISERVADLSTIHAEDAYRIVGNFRSFNQADGSGKHLKLSVFVKDIQPINEPDAAAKNEIMLVGRIAKKPECKKVQSDRELARLVLVVERPYGNGKVDYIPCVIWGRNARFIATCKKDTQVELVGRIQSREFFKKLDNGKQQAGVAYEVSAGFIRKVD